MSAEQTKRSRSGSAAAKSPTDPDQQATGADFQSEGGHGAVPTKGVEIPAPTGTEGSEKGPDAEPKETSTADGKRSSKATEWPLFEVFVRARRGLSHNHVGSLHAPDAEIALRNARDVYTRRQEGVSLWVVPTVAIMASSPDEKDSFFEPAADKAYRHPTFYDIPGRVQM